MEWRKISREILEKLYYEQGMSDRQIAEIYGVSEGAVQYRRKKYGISFERKLIRQLVNNRELWEKCNAESRERLCTEENIDRLAKALTVFAFRNGPIESMHTQGKLSQSDMKILNKYMVDRMASVLQVVFAEEWIKLEILCDYFQDYFSEWDSAVPDQDDLEGICQTVISMQRPMKRQRMGEEEEEN